MGIGLEESHDQRSREGRLMRCRRRQMAPNDTEIDGIPIVIRRGWDEKHITDPGFEYYMKL